MGEFRDERGRILDLVGSVDSITEISTIKGAVRGNHFHKLTTQWTYVVSGELLIQCGDQLRILIEGEMVEHPPGQVHAWKATVNNTVCLVFTKGPRSGENYESDTYRLEEPVL